MGQVYSMKQLRKQVAQINPASRVTWFQSLNYSHLVQPKFKQLIRYGC
jgi:hypothetical protein